MTIIKELRLRGFKSFPKLVEIPFDSGYNTVIGANGSGKSNLADSICFVLGKTSAKSLRAEKSANLIFHGGKKGQPAKEAQVDIVFNNEKKDFPMQTNEVKVTRIVRQNGNSIYKLNEDVVTRQQVVDLLSAAKIDPDGHNIVLQGDIVSFMEMKPEERRELIEEISGISIYEDKKQKAMNELEKVDSKLNEATIILTERETYMRELKKERDQAEKYKGLEGNINSNKATYIHLQIKEKEEKMDEIEKRLKEQQNEVGRYENELTELTELIAKRKEEITSINNDIEEKGEVEQKKIAVDIETLKTDLVKNTLRLDACKNELIKIESRKKQLESDLSETSKKLDELKDKRSSIEREIKTLSIEDARTSEEISKFKEKHNLKYDIVKNIDEIDSSLDSYQNQLNEIMLKKQEKQRELDKILFEISSLKITENKEKLDELKNLRGNFKDITSELSKSLNELDATASQLGRTRKSIIELNEKLAVLNAKNIGLKEFSSFDIAIRKVLDLKEKGVYGMVSDLARIQSKYSTALEVAAGPRIKSIVVDSDLTASKCISYLKDNKLGVVTFLPLNKIKSKPIPNEISPILSMPNVNGLAVKLIEYDNKFKDIFNYVFGSTVVVNDIATARKIGIGRARMVTLDGDLLETSGAMIGGFRRKTLSFKEKDFDANIESLNAELEKNKKLLDILENNEDGLNEKIKGLRNKKATLEADILKFEKAYGISDLEELKEKQSSLLEKEKDLNKWLKSYENDGSSIASEVNKLRLLKSKIKEKAADQKITDVLSKLEQDKQNIKEKIISLKSDFSSLEHQQLPMFSSEKDKILLIMKEHNKEKMSFTDEITDLNDLIKEQRSQFKEKESMQKKFFSDYHSLFLKRDKLNEDIKRKEMTTVKNEERIKSIQQRINTISIDKAKVISEFAGLNKEFEQFKDEKIRRGLNLNELKDEINKFESMLKNMGNVNLRALDIYNEAEREYNEILEKTSKLKFEKEDVLKMMQEIESKKGDMFMKTFRVISSNFKTIFSNLSTKGEASMYIENEEDIFNSGVDIKVKIIGNKSLDIRSLSGGEKSMAALAFIFAIQEYQPASFYLLDEVDAALDKTNSDLLSKLIKKYSDKAQYIVISHNDTIITEANTIYGVSMQNDISKVVSLRI